MAEPKVATNPELWELAPGRMAHYVEKDGVHLAATVCWVEEDAGGPTGLVNLHVYYPFTAPTILKERVPYDNQQKPYGTWHFMERKARPGA